MVSLRLLLLFEFNWLYASFPLAIAIALANIREHLCSFTCTLIRKRLFIYSSHAIQLNANQVKEFQRENFFSNSRLQYFDGTLNTLQFRSDSNIFNLWQSVVICEWAMSLKIHEKKMRLKHCCGLCQNAVEKRCFFKHLFGMTKIASRLQIIVYWTRKKDHWKE